MVVFCRNGKRFVPINKYKSQVVTKSSVERHIDKYQIVGILLDQNLAFLCWSKKEACWEKWLVQWNQNILLHIFFNTVRLILLKTLFNSHRSMQRKRNHRKFSHYIPKAVTITRRTSRVVATFLNRMSVCSLGENNNKLVPTFAQKFNFVQ